MLEGSCLCESIRYEIRSEPIVMYHCHCGTCRSASGASFATNILVAADAFSVIEGREKLASFESSPAKRRWFCSRCGSPIYSHADATSHVVSVRCGTLRSDPGLRPSWHAYVATRAPWTELCDGLPQMPEGAG
jgi:hypothetical protein